MSSAQNQSLGPVMFDLDGTSLRAEEIEKLRSPAAGGVILFARNYESPRQLADLVASIRAIRPRLLIAVDQEGGRVQRFRDGFTRLPPAARYRQAEDPIRTAESAGWLMAAEVRATGVDFSFAPVLDVDCGISQVIGDRAFAETPDQAADLAAAFVRGMRQAGMAAVGKHFPGHGSVAEDSHTALPVDPRDYSAIERHDLVPFRHLIDAGLQGIMASHVVYAGVAAHPAGFSAFWIREVLRRRLGFRGAVFTDDLSMAGAAVAGGPVERVGRALEAGCDMVLVCNAPGAAEAVLEAFAGLPEDPDRVRRLCSMAGGAPIDHGALLASPSWQAAVERIAALS